MLLIIFQNPKLLQFRKCKRPQKSKSLEKNKKNKDKKKSNININLVLSNLIAFAMKYLFDLMVIFAFINFPTICKCSRRNIRGTQPMDQHSSTFIDYPTKHEAYFDENDVANKEIEGSNTQDSIQGEKRLICLITIIRYNYSYYSNDTHS